MKITKYHQSCLLIEINEKRILVDPGKFGYTDEFETEWTNIDYIFVTHKHDDHCYAEIINKIVVRDNAKLFTTQEVLDNQPLMQVRIIKAGEIVDLGSVKVGVTKACHGYFPIMKGKEVKENVGYIIDDGKKRLYVTSDTICFSNDYKCDVICMPVNGNGLTLGLYDGVLFAKETGASLVLPIHFEHPNPEMNQQKEIVSTYFKTHDLESKILDIKESIEL